ncbi:MAG: class I SAM-dependent methyltransferase [bacterium]
MEKHEYAVMFRLEEDYWWYRGLRDIVFRCLDRFISRYEQRHISTARILDAGAGTGKLLAECREYHARGYHACGLEFSEHALPFLKARGLGSIVQASICRMPFHNRAFDAVTSLDVLYHAGVNSDREALVEIHRILKPGGLLILNLPAFEFLRSPHDLAVHTRRRYRAGDLRQKLQEHGFSIQVLTYRNALLFPAAVAARIIRRTLSPDGRSERSGQGRCRIASDLRPLPSWLNRLLYGILTFENALLFRGLTFPFGLSVFCVAEKK